MYYPQDSGAPQLAQETNFMYKVYGWMSLALAITAGVALVVVSFPALYQPLFTNSWLLFLVVAIQIGLAISLIGFLNKMSFVTAFVVFLLYAGSMGLSLSTIFLLYTQASIAQTFFITAGMFGGMSLYGYFTKTDLTTIGNIAVMALWGLILALIVNMFLQSAQFDYVISLIGVAVFTVLTAFDVQRIKQMGQQLIASRQAIQKVALMGAFTLYLDFINLFLYLLRFMGQRRQD